MVDIVGKPFYENYPNREKEYGSTEVYTLIKKALEDIGLILKFHNMDVQDKLKLIHELAEQALKKDEISIFLCVHNSEQHSS